MKIETPKYDISLFTRFSQNYFSSDKLQIGAQTQAVIERDKENGPEEHVLYAIAGDSTIVRFYQDPQSSTAYNSVELKLKGHFIAAASDTNNKSILFASLNEDVYCMYINNSNQMVYGKYKYREQILDDSIQSGLPGEILGMYASRDYLGINLAILLKEENPHLPGEYQRRVIVINGVNKNLIIPLSSEEEALMRSDIPKPESAPELFEGCSFSWTHDIKTVSSVFAMMSWDEVLYTWSGPNKTFKSTILNKYATKKCIDMTSVFVRQRGHDMENVLMMLFEDGTMRGYIPATGRWTKEFKSRLFAEVLGYSETIGPYLDQDVTHVFGRAADKSGEVYHGYLDYINGEYELSEMTPIDKGVSEIALSNMSLHEHPTTGRVLWMIPQNGESADMLISDSGRSWKKHSIKLPCKDGNQKMAPASTYMTEVTVYDKNGSACPYVGINVTANQNTRVEVNGLVYFIDTNKSAFFLTNMAGKIFISQETSTISMPDLILNFEGGLGYEEDIGLSISQHEVVKNRLAVLTGEELLKAEKFDGKKSEPLLGEKDRNETTTNALAKSITTALKLRPAYACSDVLSKGISGRPMGCALVTAEDFKKLNLLTIPEGFGGFSLKKIGDELEYKSLTPEETAAYFNSIAPTNASFGFFRSIGDFFTAVANGIVEVVETVVGVVNDVIEAAFRIGEETIKFVVKTTQEIMSVVETAFSKVAVFFEEVFQWLAFVFNWGDIIKTKNAIKENVSSHFKISRLYTKKLSDKSVAGLRYLQNENNKNFDMLKDLVSEKLSDDATLGAAKDKAASAKKDTPESEQVDEAMSNNVIMSNLTERDLSINSNIAALSISGFNSLEMPQELREGIETFLELIEDFVDEIKQTDAFGKAVKYFDQAISDEDAWMNLMLLGMIEMFKGISSVFLSGIRLVVECFFEIVIGMIDMLEALLKKEIELPFVSALYKSVSGGDALSIIDLVCLIGAVPVTVVYKIFTGENPGDIEPISYDQILASIQKLEKDANENPDKPSEPIKDTQDTARRVFLITGTVFATLSGVLNIISDTVDIVIAALGSIKDGSKIKGSPFERFLKFISDKATQDDIKDYIRIFGMISGGLAIVTAVSAIITNVSDLIIAIVWSNHLREIIPAGAYIVSAVVSGIFGIVTFVISYFKCSKTWPGIVISAVEIVSAIAGFIAEVAIIIYLAACRGYSFIPELLLKIVLACADLLQGVVSKFIILVIGIEAVPPKVKAVGAGAAIASDAIGFIAENVVRVVSVVLEWNENVSGTTRLIISKPQHYLIGESYA